MDRTRYWSPFHPFVSSASNAMRAGLTTKRIPLPLALSLSSSTSLHGWASSIGEELSKVNPFWQIPFRSTAVYQECCVQRLSAIVLACCKIARNLVARFCASALFSATTEKRILAGFLRKLALTASQYALMLFRLASRIDGIWVWLSGMIGFNNLHNPARQIWAFFGSASTQLACVINSARGLWHGE